MFSRTIREWYRQHARHLPWRSTHDPYRIWISEVILQQTRVDQGLPYYERFIELFPDVKTLAAAADDRVMRAWQGLGYYSRARNLHKAAKQIMQEFNGRFPSTYAELRSLSGIGDYTASAISSFAFNEAHAVVDGNVYRVLARFKGADIPVDTTAGKKYFKELATDLLDHQHAGEHNQAIMELGALICKPAQPLCDACPVNLQCIAHHQHTQTKLPVKLKKQRIRERYFHFYYITDREHLLLTKRENSDIWKGLYQFPLYETDQPAELSSFEKNIPSNLKTNLHYQGSSKTYRHQLSHQTIYAVFHSYTAEQLRVDDNNELQLILKKDLNHFALPRLILNFLNDIS